MRVSSREFERVPCAVQIQYRSASSFLIAYATNLSRGGLFLESDDPLAVGTDLALELDVPDVGKVAVQSQVAWTREAGDDHGPPGMGLIFSELTERVGALIDGLVGDFEGIRVALLSRDGRASKSVGRAIRSAIATAEVLEITDAKMLDGLGEGCELVVIDADSEPDGGVKAVSIARDRARPLPAIVLSSSAALRAVAKDGGALALANPPAVSELGGAAVRALSRPLAIRSRLTNRD